MVKKSNGKEGKETRIFFILYFNQPNQSAPTIQHGEEKQWERREKDKEKKKLQAPYL